ncbi:MAG: TonB-dependent receptor plug domain-containing protein, partial [Calditrichota bacterium]
MLTRLSGLIWLIFLGLMCSVVAQIDTTVYKLETIVVTGDRAEHALKEATIPVSVLNEKEIRSLPARNLVDLLSHVAGLDFVDQDGDGLLPMPVVRGFFGGGESEYVLLIVDGVAQNDLRSGLVNWNAVAVEDIQRIEVSRGGGSAIYGDQAIGAVINIQTVESREGRFVRTNLSSGSFESRGANLQTGFSNSANNVSLALSGYQSDGFRDHSEWTNAEARLKYQRKFGYRSKFTTSVDIGRLDKDEPGPLTRDQLSNSRVQSQTLFANDNRLRNRVNVATHLFNPFSDLVSFTASAGVNYLTQDQVRTIQVASNFGNTQRKEESNVTGWTQLQFRAKQGIAEWIAGVDADLGSYD